MAASTGAHCGGRMAGSRRAVVVPLARRRPACVVRASSGDSHKTRNSQGDSDANVSSLDERILSGEFTDSGSTKEKITRPLRKLLAKDPVGLGEYQEHGCYDLLTPIPLGCGASLRG